MVIFESRKERQKSIKLVKTYLDIRQTFFDGFQNYYFFRRRIAYALGDSDRKKVRSIFNYFLKEKIIEHHIVRKSHLYLYNPNQFSHEILHQMNRTIQFK
mgnify:CR=1 FL=1